jgi:RND family efflux transporter MFP subunit
MPQTLRTHAWPWLMAGAACLLVLGGCRGNHADAPVSTSTPVAPIATARRMQLSNTLQVAGEFLPFQEVDLHAKVAGYIGSIHVDIGDHVRAGEVLATLDVPELTAQVQGATASVRQSSEQVDRARSEVQNAQASAIALHSEAQRLQQASAAQPGLIAQQELDNANAKDQAAQAQVSAAKSALSATQQQMQVSQATQQQTSVMAGYSRIVAPFSGVVTARYADPGALIQAGTSNAASAPVLKISEIDKLRLRLPVPASMVTFVHDGDPVTVHIPELNRTLSGTVTRSTDALDMATDSEQVEVDVPNLDGSIKPGMFGNVTLAIHHSADSITVPVNAVDRSSDQPFVLVVDSSHHVQHRDIAVGLTTPDRVEVLSGLGAGEQVIAANLGSYQQGELVSPQASALGDSGAGQGGQ